MLDERQVDSYRERGYIAMPDVFSPDEIAELARVTEEFVEASRRTTEHTDVFDLEPDHTPDSPRLRRIKLPSAHHPVYAAALRHEGVLDIVSQLVGPSIRTNGEKLNMKSAEWGSPVEWHQDWAFYPHTNDDMLAVGIAIDDMTLDNGCLLVIPGSHLGPLYDHHQDGVFVGGIADPAFRPEGALPIEVEAGGISIHHVRLLHGSAPNRSKSERRLLLFQYLAGDAWPLHGAIGVKGDLAAFYEEMLRGEPSNQPRVEPVPVRLPLPASQRTGSIYDTQTLMASRPLAGVSQGD